MAIVDNYTEQELRQIVAQSTSMNDLSRRLGYSATTGNTNQTIKKRLDKYQIDISHFNCFIKPKEDRTEENIFVENSTASQKVLRSWYKKGNYTEYKCSICSMAPEWQGKPLTLILDHKNGKNHDDRLENLRWVCPNCNQQLETTGFKKFRTKDLIKKKYYCQKCGIEITKDSKSGLCSNCVKETQRVVDRPNRDELKQLIRTKPFTKIGEDYGVSDKAISKWCIAYNLPNKKSVIKTFSDDDWKKI